MVRLHYGHAFGNEHSRGDDSSRYGRCGKRQRAALFSTFQVAWKNNFSKWLTTRERKKQQCHQKVLCANMCIYVLVPSFSMGNIWSGEISGMFLQFFFLRWYPEFPSLELLISVCSRPKCVWQTPIPWLENLGPASLVRANLTKQFTILHLTSFVSSLKDSYRDLLLHVGGCVRVCERVSRLHCCGVVATVLWELSSHLYITTSSNVIDTVPASTVVVVVWISALQPGMSPKIVHSLTFCDCNVSAIFSVTFSILNYSMKRINKCIKITGHTCVFP